MRSEENLRVLPPPAPPTTHSRTPRHVNKRDVNNIVEETVRTSGEGLPLDYFFWSLVRSDDLEKGGG